MPADTTIRITWIGAAANVALSVVKISVGLAVGSISLVADGVHSFADLLTDAAVIIGIKAAARPADHSHPYGHGKYETLAAVFISAVLMAVGFGIVWKSSQAFLSDSHPSPTAVVLVVAVLSVVVKEWLYWATRRAAIAAGSAAALANAWHHRSDALSSVAVFAGTILAMTGWSHGDQLAGVVVGVMVVAAGGKLLAEALQELSEATVDRAVHDALERILERNEEARDWHRARGRRVGRQIFLDCHVLVDPNISVRASHALTQRIEHELREALSVPVNLLIHIEPYEE